MKVDTDARIFENNKALDNKKYIFMLQAIKL